MRYIRQEIFLGKKVQKFLDRSTVTIVGLGALGTVAAELLARSGANLKLIDRDLIDLTNLQRQSLFDKKDINKPKVLIANEKLSVINSNIKIEAFFEHLDFENINLVKSNLILDCTDNLEIRYLINEYCIKNKVPFIYGAAIRDKGYVYNIFGKPCLRCILKDSLTHETCETSGVLNTVTNIVASIQVNEAIRILSKENPEKNLLYINLQDNSITKIKVNADKKCPVCNGKFEYLEGKKARVYGYCNSFIFKEKFDYNLLKESFNKLGAKNIQDAIIFDKITVFPKSILIKATSKKEARSLYSRYIGN